MSNNPLEIQTRLWSICTKPQISQDMKSLSIFHFIRYICGRVELEYQAGWIHSSCFPCIFRFGIHILLIFWYEVFASQRVDPLTNFLEFSFAGS